MAQRYSGTLPKPPTVLTVLTSPASESGRFSVGSRRAVYASVMFLISIFVVTVVLYVANGRQLPVDIVDRLRDLIPNDETVSEQHLALSFLSGVLVAGTPFHTVVRYLSTVVHELGHAFTAGLLGGRPKNITIATNGSGLATYQPPITWGRFRATIVSLAGYPASPIAAIAAVQAAQGGHVKAWFAFSAGTLALAIVMLIRNFWGVLWTAGVVAASYFGARELDIKLLGLVVGGVAGYLAIQGLRDAWEQMTIVRFFPESFCDAEMVARWWKVDGKFVGFLHLSAVTALSGLATYLAVNPYWSEILDWTQKQF